MKDGEDEEEDLVENAEGRMVSRDELNEYEELYYANWEENAIKAGISIAEFVQNCERAEGAIDDDDLDEPGASGAQIGDNHDD
jgi:hypothetical protein